MASKKGKPNRVPSKVYKNIKWDFTEIADELEKLRLEHAPNTEHNERFPLAWILRAANLTGLDNERDGYQPIQRAFEACGITKKKTIAELAGYADQRSINNWDFRTMSAEKVQERFFPALCDAYCIARKSHPHRKSATFQLEKSSSLFENPEGFHVAASVGLDAIAPVGGDAKTLARLLIGINRRNIELEAMWLLLCGWLDSHPSIAKGSYTATRAAYRRAIAGYAAMLLEGDELGDLAHVAAALVAQHIAAHGHTDWGEYDGICLSSKRGMLDFMADRHNPDSSDGSVPLHTEVTTKELEKSSEAIWFAMLRYADTISLCHLGQGIRAELERRSKIGGYYMPELHAEIEPADEEEPSS